MTPLTAASGVMGLSTSINSEVGPSSDKVLSDTGTVSLTGSLNHDISFVGYQNAILRAEKAIPVPTSFSGEMRAIKEEDQLQWVE